MGHAGGALFDLNQREGEKEGRRECSGSRCRWTPKSQSGKNFERSHDVLLLLSQTTRAIPKNLVAQALKQIRLRASGNLAT
jgi:hypothetical protein